MTMNSNAETPRRQFRLASLLLGVTLAAAAFAWVRTWEPDNARGMAALVGVFVGALVPPLVARRLIRSDFFRRGWYGWTVVLSLIWLPWSGFLFSVVAESIRPTGRESLIFTTLSWAGFCTIVVPTIAVIIDILLRRFRSEDYRAGTIGAVAAVVMLVSIVDFNYRFGPPQYPQLGSSQHYIPSTFAERLYWVCFYLIWIAPLGASFALRCLKVRRGPLPPESQPPASVVP
ncbi:MAG: hypothetical protein J0M17_11430 [Planctomycetes bacterium]|nr:hypothetical protein [Planctomycetota bacterium]